MPALIATLAAVSSVQATPSCGGSPLAFCVLARTETPELILAQRNIDREWTTKTDSTYLPLVGGVSEPAVTLMSAVLPGSGQLYMGEKSGYLFALVEVASWAGWVFLNHRADDERDQAAAVAGVPEDSTSGWSFDRWEDATEGDATDIRQLYDLDREAYFDVIQFDDTYAAGWSDAGTRTEYGHLRDSSDQKLEDAGKVQTVLWVNHLAAAFDALRAARQHNMPLRSGLELKAKGGWKGRGPSMTLVLERKF